MIPFNVFVRIISMYILTAKKWNKVKYLTNERTQQVQVNLIRKLIILELSSRG